MFHLGQPKLAQCIPSITETYGEMKIFQKQHGNYSKHLETLLLSLQIHFVGHFK